MHCRFLRAGMPASAGFFILLIFPAGLPAAADLTPENAASDGAAAQSNARQSPDTERHEAQNHEPQSHESHGTFEAIYDGKLKKIAGGKVRLAAMQNEDGGYTFEYSIMPGRLIRLFTRGTLRETTKFDVIDGRPRALDYTLYNTLGSKPRNGHVAFDWERGIVTGNYKEKAIDIPIPENAADRSMLQLILMADLRNDNLQQRYWAYDKDEFIPIRVERLGEETIETPVGKFSTVVLRYAEEEDTGDTVLWCAGELGYLPVRIRANDEGKEVLVAKLTALTGSPAD